MGGSFTPGYRNFQKDIELLLESEGKREKNEAGQLVYRGYPAALETMFRNYLDKRALAPLVSELKRWNWEWSYSDYLLTLTERLRSAGDWPLLEELWAGVIAKRRTNYNKTKTAQKAVPEKIPAELVEKTQALLLEALGQLRTYADELDKSPEIASYLEMIARVERGIKA